MTERALSFGTAADDYDRLRPRPPLEVVNWLVPDRSARVLDLGAGTGIMTRQLLATGHDVVAVEPDERMRAVLAQRSPSVTVLAGTGENIPLANADVDAVVVSSAWHWMDPELAVPEIARVLRPAGAFGVVWNRRDFSVDWFREAVFAVAPSERHHERLREARRLELPAGSPFGPVTMMTHAFTIAMSPEEVAGAIGTYSEVTVRGALEAARIVENAREMLIGRFGSSAVIDVPFRCIAFRTIRN